MKAIVIESACWFFALFAGMAIVLFCGIRITPDLLQQGADPRNAQLLRADDAFLKSLVLEPGSEKSNVLAVTEKSLRQSLSLSDSALLRGQLGTVLEMQQRPGDALIEYAKSHLYDLDELPQSQRLQQGVKALALLQEAERYEFDQTEGAKTTFTASIAANQLDTARTAIDKLSTVLPNDEVAWMQSQVAEAEGNQSEAERLWRKTLGLNPTHWEAALRLSQSANTHEQHQEAIAILQRVLFKHDSRPGLWHELAVQYAAMGDLPNAMTAIEKAYSRGPWSAFYAHRFADLLEQDGQNLRARKMRAIARTLDPVKRPEPLLLSK